MSIEGIAIREKVGAFEVLRSPKIIIESKRRQIVGKAVLEIPDPFGTVRPSLKTGQSVQIIMRYRGETNLEQTWQGTLFSVDTEGENLLVTARGLEQTLLDNTLTEAFYEEPVNLVVRRILQKTGLGTAEIDMGDYTLPHMVFAGVTIAKAIKQLSQSVSRSFGKDLSKHALWLDADNNWNFRNGEEQGTVFTVETAKNLISHRPPQREGEMGEIETVLLPGLTHSRLIKIRDSVRDIVKTVRVQEAEHRMVQGKNRTIIRYGKDQGWG